MVRENKFESALSRHGVTPRTLKLFQRLVLDYYESDGRKDLPFRVRHSPYEVLVSEIMLQQTQVERGIQKFNEFTEAFPDFSALASAPLPKLLKVWQGLGYNRRALALQKCAQRVMQEYGGRLPSTEAELIDLPCIGPYTAGAIRAFAFNQPVTIIETNIRTVFIHFFFRNKKSVPDTKLMPLIAKTVYAENPRIWYYALMDYGVKLKKEHPNPSRKSKHHVKQAKFKGSLREARGKVLKAVVSAHGITHAQLTKAVGLEHERVETAVKQLVAEGFISKKKQRYIVL